MVTNEQRIALCIAAILLEEGTNNIRPESEYRKEGPVWGAAHRSRISEGGRSK